MDKTTARALDELGPSLRQQADHWERLYRAELAVAEQTRQAVRAVLAAHVEDANTALRTVRARRRSYIDNGGTSTLTQAVYAHQVAIAGEGHDALARALADVERVLAAAPGT